MTKPPRSEAIEAYRGNRGGLARAPLRHRNDEELAVSTSRRPKFSAHSASEV